MADPRHIIAIDQGTTSTRALIFDEHAAPVAVTQIEYPQYHPHPGWVEQDAENIWRDTVAMVRAVLANAKLTARDIAAIGITNQRETTVLWDRATGEPLHRAIVWQDRRTADACAAHKAAGHEAIVRARTGLLLDPYFSATKLAWLLDHVPGARARAETGDLAFGTVDSFLLWRLTGGRVHATDATNASRTMLFDIHRQRWCPDLLALFDIPESLLPRVGDSSEIYGHTSPDLFGAPIPIAGIAGDQQAALVGHGCFAPGSAKATYGTGCFLLLNTGTEALNPGPGLLTTTAYRFGGKPAYAIEGSIFVAGAAIKWLRDTLGIIAAADETEALASGLADNGGVYFVPAFVGLGAPHWRPEARGLITGLTLDSGRAHLARAALEAVAYQTADLIDAIAAANDARPARMSVDGGMVANGWLCHFLADILNLPFARPAALEVTARGAAVLAGMGAGLWDRDIINPDKPDADLFAPAMNETERQRLRAGWQDAIGRTLMRGAGL
jgi:glycerol kinase